MAADDLARRAFKRVQTECCVGCKIANIREFDAILVFSTVAYLFLTLHNVYRPNEKVVSNGYSVHWSLTFLGMST